MKKTDDELKAIAQAALTGAPEVNSVWQHYKGGIYVVVAVSLKEDTLEPLVTYRSNSHGTYWTRTLENFTEEVLVAMGDPKDITRPRFDRFPG